jgi:hypothetical protein
VQWEHFGLLHLPVLIGTLSRHFDLNPPAFGAVSHGHRPGATRHAITATVAGPCAVQLRCNKGESGNDSSGTSYAEL